MLTHPYIDIHTHGNMPDDEQHISVVSMFAQDYQQASTFDKKYFSIGLHPWHVNDVNINDILPSIEQTVQSPYCLGIGEIGLDHVSTVPLDKQIIAFEKQLLLAQQLELPVILHNVKSLTEITQLLKKVKFNQPVIFHGFTGKIEMAYQILEYGNTFLSFGKSIHHSNTSLSLDLIPINRIFFETDDDKNLNIEEVYQTATGLLHSTVDKCKERIYNNFITVFKKYNAKLA